MDEVKEASTKHLWFPSTQMKGLSPKNVKITVKGEGIFLKDAEGNEYMDAFAGQGNLIFGYGEKHIPKDILRQTNEVPYTPLLPGWTSPPALELANRLVKLAPSEMDKVFFMCSGGEANEVAMKLARQYFSNKGMRKYKVVSRWFSYQGSTMGAMSSSGTPPRRVKFEPLMGGFVHVFPPYCYRCPYEKTYPECDVLCARLIEETIKHEGAETVCAFIGDLITSWLMILPPDEYWPKIRQICNELDILMIIDEVVTAPGRLGKMFGCDVWHIKPDMITLGKAISGGYYPLSATIARSNISKAFWADPEEGKEFNHLLTYGGTPPACTAGVATLKKIENEGLVRRVESLGKYFEKRLMDLQEDCPFVGDVRGKGLMWGVEVVKDKKTKEVVDISRLSHQLLEERVLTRVGPMISVIEIEPPYIVTEEQLDEIVNRIENSVNACMQRH